MILYNLVDKFLMNDFNKEIKENLKTKQPIIFDIGCFNGNFSKKLKKYLDISKKKFYLFDANKDLKISEGEVPLTKAKQQKGMKIATNKYWKPLSKNDT